MLHKGEPSNSIRATRQEADTTHTYKMRIPHIHIKCLYQAFSMEYHELMNCRFSRRYPRLDAGCGHAASTASHVDRNSESERPSRMATHTGKPAARMIVPLAAAGPLVLASVLAVAPPVHAAATWMAGAVNSSKTEAFFYRNAYTQFDAEQHAMANCQAKFPTGCQLAGSTTTCMAVALGPGSQYSVAYAPTAQAAQVMAVMEIHGRANPSGAQCSWG
jgi:Domain of unknown function (DUF4189)